jgi:hypothetical protein
MAEKKFNSAGFQVLEFKASVFILQGRSSKGQ